MISSAKVKLTVFIDINYIMNNSLAGKSIKLLNLEKITHQTEFRKF